MKFVVNVRHRPTMGETIEQKLERLVSGMRQISAPWGLRDGSDLKVPPVGTGLSTGANLKGKLGSGITGRVAFMYRAPANLRDDGSKDDSLILEFNAAKVSWQEFVQNAFPNYVTAVDAYIGYIYRWDASLEEWRMLKERARETGKNLDGRDGFFRFGPVGFMDGQLCRRACGGLTPDHIVERLTGAVPDVRRLNDGVLIVAADHFPMQDEIIATDRRIRERLGLPVWD